MRIFADWGTSNLRAWLVSDAGDIVRRYESTMGLRDASAVGFSKVFAGVVDQLKADPDTPAIIFGMASSQKGWQEVPYTPGPADAAAIARNTQRIKDRPRTWLVGGVNFNQDADHPEVMRGEEVLALGVLKDHPAARWICMPGTHSKWVATSDGKLTAITTFMTGELFDWLTQQSIISTQIDEANFDPTAFERGCELAQSAIPLTNALFQLRTQFLAGHIQASQVHSMASGLVIGHEVTAMARRVSGTVALCAASRLAQAYRAAFAFFGLECVLTKPERAAVAGLLTLSPLIKHGTNA